MLTRYMHMHRPLYSHTFIGSFEFVDLHIQVHVYSILLIRYLERITDILRSQSSRTRSSILGILLLLFILIVIMIMCIGLIAYSFPLFIYYHVWSFICYIAVLSYHHSDYIACSGYFKLSLYTWSILLVYIRR